MSIILTKQNQDIIQRLDKKNYDGITQRQITSMIKKVLDNKSESTKKIANDVYLFEKAKFPSKSSKQLEQYISKKLDKNDKSIWREYISDYTSFETGGTKDTEGSTNEEKKMVNEVLPGGDFGSQNTTKKVGSDKQLNDLLDKLLSDGKEVKTRDGGVILPPGAAPENVPVMDRFSGKGRSLVPVSEKQSWSDYLSETKDKFGPDISKDEINMLKKTFDKTKSALAKKQKERKSTGKNAGGGKEKIAKIPIIGDISVNDVVDTVSSGLGTGSEVLTDTLLSPILGPELASIIGRGVGGSIENIFDKIGNAYFDTSRYTPALAKDESSFIQGFNKDGTKGDGFYSTRNGKRIIGKSSNIDLAQHSNQLKQSGKLLQQLYTSAKSLGELTSGQSELIYNVSKTLESVLSGTSKISYDQLGELMKVSLENLPSNVINEYRQDIDNYSKQIRTEIQGGQNQNESIIDMDYTDNLGLKQEVNADVDADVEQDKQLEPETIEDINSDVTEKIPEVEPEPPQSEIQEKALDDTTGNNLDDGFPRLRPKGVWGGTDKIFTRNPNEVATATLISESMNIEPAGWGNGPSNPLYKRNLMDDDRRYGRTFSMPTPAPEPNTTIPAKFEKLTNPIWTSQLAPTMRPFQDVSWDPYSFQQFSEFGWENQPTVYPTVNEETNRNYYPHRINMQTGGMEQRVNNRDFNWIQNQRFTR